MRLPTLLSRRKRNSHKGDYGHVLVVAGSKHYAGAGLLCAESCLRSGAGLVTLAVPQGILGAVNRNKIKEVMVLGLPQTAQGSISCAALRQILVFLKKCNCLALGPGLSLHPSTAKMALCLIAQCPVPLVIDADGLNALDGHLQVLKARGAKGLRTVLTPHPGEMARLLGRSADSVEKDRKEVAKTFARNYNSVIVLKGFRTIVAGPAKTYVNHTGNPGMATAGSGDVLTGIIAAFLGQGMDNFSAATYAVYLHGLAGDIAADEKTQISLIASDIIAALPQAVKRCLK